MHNVSLAEKLKNIVGNVEKEIRVPSVGLYIFTRIEFPVKTKNLKS